jgi:hypothetical protein
MNKSIWIILVLALAPAASIGAGNDTTELAGWRFVGKGFTAPTDDGVVLSEYPDSTGVMLISPGIYACDTRLILEVMPLNPESVFVVMMAASGHGPDPSLRLPTPYDGGIAPLLNDTDAYFFALHNGAHNRTPFVRKHPFDREKSKDLATFPSHVMTRQWHEIEVVHACDGGLRLAVDSKTIIETIDTAPLQSGQIVLRLRGTKTHTAAALFRNVSISAAPISRD